MRPCVIFLLFLVTLAVADGGLLLHRHLQAAKWSAEAANRQIVVAGLGLTDLAVATEARYTRHPTITDRVVAVMDHPGAIEHFPSGSFWAPPSVRP